MHEACRACKVTHGQVQACSHASDELRDYLARNLLPFNVLMNGPERCQVPPCNAVHD